jgi:hypothetical protein
MHGVNVDSLLFCSPTTTTPICLYRKWHAVTGNLLALFLNDMMEDSLNELVAKTNGTTSTTFIDKLRTDEKSKFEQFMSFPLKKIRCTDGKEFKLPGDIDKDIFFRGPNFCHTARLPAEIRHLGILTDSSKIGEDSYDKGMSKGAIQKYVPDGSMPLVFDGGERQKCEEPLQKDYKDYFLVKQAFGWTQLTLPTDREVEAYGTGAPLHGYISVCFRHDGGFRLGGNQMEVNGMRVTNFTKHRKCMWLKNAKGHKFEPNSDGRFEIRARAEGKINTFGIW